MLCEEIGRYVGLYVRANFHKPFGLHRQTRQCDAIKLSAPSKTRRQGGLMARISVYYDEQWYSYEDRKKVRWTVGDLVVEEEENLQIFVDEVCGGSGSS